MTQNQKAMLDATSGIRDTYIEEAAAKQFHSHRWGYKTAIAAVLALIIGAFCLFGQNPDTGEPIPFFAIRAYAEDNSFTVLNELGDSVQLTSLESALFPGKNVFIIEVSLEDYSGDPADLDMERFWVFHRNGNVVRPGEKDQNLAVEWTSPEEDGFLGYRITGWCESTEYISLRIYNHDGSVVHEKQLYFTYDDGYSAFVHRAFHYHDDMSTDELITETFRQNYYLEQILSSDSNYHALLKGICGFPELRKRPDAATKMLAQFERIVDGEHIYENYHLIASVLLWPEFQSQMTEDEQAHFAVLYDRFWEQVRSQAVQK